MQRLLIRLSAIGGKGMLRLAVAVVLLFAPACAWAETFSVPSEDAVATTEYVHVESV